ncbi:hypothetical protein [Paenibacillus sp. FSL R10-2734]
MYEVQLDELLRSNLRWDEGQLLRRGIAALSTLILISWDIK